MPTVNLTGTTDGSGLLHDTWILGAGSRYTALATNDGDTSYLSTIGVTFQDMKFSDWPSIGFINSITASVVGKDITDPKTITYGVENGSGTSTDTYLTTGAYVLDTSSALSKPGGGAWLSTDGEVDTTWFHMSADADGGNEVRVTQAYLTLDYETPGGFVFAFGLGPALAGLQAFPFFRDFTAFMASWQRRSPECLLSGAEVRRAWSELREHRAPVWGV